MKTKDKLVLLAIVAGVGYVAFEEFVQGDARLVAQDPVAPNWAAIAKWPNQQVDVVEAQPDPNRRVTAIVLDDSGSMGEDIIPAKAAVTRALDAMAEGDKVSVIALNAGVILPFTPVSDARAVLPGLLRPIGSNGGTPLTQSINQARMLLEAEAAATRAFGTFRLIVTTDGQADDSDLLDAVVEEIAASTPIQIATIGIGVSGGHVLRRNDIGSFVDVANVDALQDALKAAVAENTDFNAITEFAETEE